MQRVVMSAAISSALMMALIYTLNLYIIYMGATAATG